MGIVNRKSMPIDKTAELEYLKAKVSELEKITLGMAEKVGYKLEKVAETENGSEVFEFQKDETIEHPLGSYLNPILYELGMVIQKDEWYSDGKNIWEAKQNGTPDGFDDESYFDIIK